MSDAKSPLVLALPIITNVPATITEHFCDGCAGKAQMQGVQAVAEVGKLEESDHADFRALSARLETALEPIINEYSEGRNAKQALVAITTALLNSQIGVVEQALSGLHPFARLMWFHGVMRTQLLQIAGATEIYAMREHGVALQPEKAHAFAEGLDSPIPVMSMLEVMGGDSDRRLAADATVRDAVRKMADSLPEELRDRLLAKVDAIERGETVALGGGTGAISGMIELSVDGDETPEELAAMIQAQLKAKGGPDLPLDQVAAMIAQGGGVIKLDATSEAADKTKH